MARADAEKKGGSFLTLLGIAAGAAIGAGVALVYAPGKGEENRKHLGEWVQARVEDIQTKIEDRITG